MDLKTDLLSVTLLSPNKIQCRNEGFQGFQEDNQEAEKAKRPKPGTRF